ncbi:MAG: hypothetical protein KC713_07815, partial [Candidatus Omnitrophica bacterium]|nr:hypothetical protein [Candidatus Omnitrophota bacterium]
RVTSERISKELRESGSDAGGLKVALFNNTGIGGSDIIRFSIPIQCEQNGEIMDVNGDVANWGASLNWGCQDDTCMDADNDCSTLDYAFIEYRLGANNQLIRRVLDNGLTTVKDDVFAVHITDFQTQLSADQNMVTITITASTTTVQNRSISETKILNVLLRNRG